MSSALLGNRHATSNDDLPLSSHFLDTTPVYLTPKKTFHKLSSDLDFSELLSHCDQAGIEQAQRQIRSKLSDRTQLSLHPTHS